jgi:hypothetical protein
MFNVTLKLKRRKIRGNGVDEMTEDRGQQQRYLVDMVMGLPLS